jgi:superfamily II DNA or RNA helicase
MSPILPFPPKPPIPLSSLAAALSSSVPAKIRERGIEYLRKGLVRLTDCTSARVTARVSGTQAYDVTLTREGDVVWADCSCPFCMDREEVCKHIWAAVLAANGRGGLRDSRSGLPKRLVVGDVDWDGWEEDEDLEREEEARDPSASLLEPPPRTPAAVPAKPSGWREILAPIAGVAPALAVTNDEILYAIDLQTSLHRQGLTLQMLAFKRKQDGSRGALRQLRITRGQASQLRSSQDRAVLSLLSGAMHGDAWASWYLTQHQEVPGQPWVPNEMAQEVAKRLCATGRCYFRTGHLQIEEPPLVWDEGPPWELWLAVREDTDGVCEVVPELRRGDQGEIRLDARERIVLAEAGLLIAPGELAAIDTGGAAAWLRLLSRTGPLGPLRVPAAERDDLLEALFAAPVLPRLDLPASMEYEEATIVPRPQLRLLPPSPGYLRSEREWPVAKVSYLYDRREVSAEAGGRGVYQKEERKFFLRDREAEEKAFERLAPLGFRTLAGTSPSGEPTLRIPPKRVPEAVRTLIAEGWSVEAQGKVYRSPGAFTLNVASGIDWFELRGDVEFEGETVDLPRLLAALKKGDGFVPLSDGSLGMLPEKWLARWAPLAGLAKTEKDHLRFELPQALLLDAWLADEPAASVDLTFAQARERLRAFSGIAAADAPAGFRGELRPYQKLGLGWLHFLREYGLGGCLADDMGLGKTVQVLALLECRREERAAQGRKAKRLPPSLVVVPRSLVFNWLAEAAQFTPQLKILDYTGIGRGESAPFVGYDVVLTTYGTLRRDIAELKNVELDYVILDEAQAIKNAGSQTAKAARLLRGHHRLALSGTPVENHLGELWSLLEFLNPGFVSSGALGGKPGAATRTLDRETSETLARALRPLILRRSKEQVAPELPARVEQTLVCELSPRQRKLYDELRDYYRAVLDRRIGAQGLGKSKILVLEALLRLRQAACHPALVDRGHADEPCAKLDLLLPQLAEVLAEGHRALVFSQFTSFLALLRRQLDATGVPYLYLDGKTKNRQELVEEFQSEGGRPLFLISLKAGGLGLNLTAADYVYLLDPWWNPAVEAQAVDRAHRIGQTRTVFAYRLVARDTVEEKILELQAGKRALADAIVQADESLMAALSREDLALLLS